MRNLLNLCLYAAIAFGVLTSAHAMGKKVDDAASTTTEAAKIEAPVAPTALAIEPIAPQGIAVAPQAQVPGKPQLPNFEPKTPADTAAANYAQFVMEATPEDRKIIGLTSQIYNLRKMTGCFTHNSELEALAAKNRQQAAAIGKSDLVQKTEELVAQTIATRPNGSVDCDPITAEKVAEHDPQQNNAKKLFQKMDARINKVYGKQ